MPVSTDVFHTCHVLCSPQFTQVGCCIAIFHQRSKLPPGHLVSYQETAVSLWDTLMCLDLGVVGPANELVTRPST